MLLVGVEAVGRLVEDQHFRIVQDRLREPDPAPVPFRQRVDALIEHRFQVQQADDLVETASALIACQPANVGDELEESQRSHFRIARRTFGQVADPALGFAARGLDVETANGRGARGRGQEARDDAHRRRLAGAVGAQETEHLAGPHAEAQLVHGPEPTVLLSQLLTVDHFTYRPNGRARRARSGEKFCIEPADDSSPGKRSRDRPAGSVRRNRAQQRRAAALRPACYRASTTLPSESSMCTSPKPSARTSSPITSRSPTTTQVRRSGASTSFAALRTAAVSSSATRLA